MLRHGGRQEEVCEFCLNSGFVQNVEYNDDIHAFIPNGMIECTHPDPDDIERDLEVKNNLAIDHFKDEQI